MYGQFIIISREARTLSPGHFQSWWQLPAQIDFQSPASGIHLASCVPEHIPAGGMTVRSDDDKILLSVDGYLFCDSQPASMSQPRQFQRLANIISDRGILAGLASIWSGAYSLMAFDRERQAVYVANDHFASIPLYMAALSDGCVISSSPVAMARSGLIDTAPDWTACAEWALTGHTIGPRHFLSSMRQLDPHICLVYELKSGQKTWLDRGPAPIYWETYGELPSVAEIKEGFEKNLQHLNLMDSHPACLMSAGKDSRLILAAWPRGHNPRCYTYGDPDSLEVGIAKEAADLRGSEWNHVWVHGNDMAAQIESIFAANGLIVFPDRFLAARQMARAGHRGVLDGLFGDMWLGWGYHMAANTYGGIVPKLLRYLTVHVDGKISKIGLGRIVEAVYDDLAGKASAEPLGDYCREDFISLMHSQKEIIHADIEGDLKRLMPANDSVGQLRSNFMMANRSAHAIIQQGIMCRSFVQVYYPFADNLEFMRLQVRMPRERAAYCRPLIDLYRKYYHEYGQIRYGSSLMPFNVSPLRHQLSKQLQAHNLKIPGLTGKNYGRARDANSWGAWLRESDQLRTTVLDMLRAGGILEESRAAVTMQAIRDGVLKGSGKLFHMAAIGKWLAMANMRATPSALLTRHDFH